VLKANKVTVDKVPVGTVLEILKQEKKWLSVKHNQKGWIDESMVVSLQSHIAALNKQADEACKKSPVDARKLYEQVLTLEPTNKHALLEHADTFYAEGRYHEAIAGYEKALQADPQKAKIRNFLGDAYWKLNDDPRSIEQYSLAIQLDPQNASAFRMRGVVKLRAKDGNGAIVDFTIACRLEKEPSSKAHAYSIRGKAWLELNDAVAAAADYAQAVELLDHPLYRMKLARILATSPDENSRDGTRAVSHALKVCEVTGYKHLPALEILAAAYAESGQFAAAATAQERAIATASDEAKIVLRKALEGYRNREPLRESSVMSLATK
jgi:tetratricopeptide (TPR) repeat protein